MAGKEAYRTVLVMQNNKNQIIFFVILLNLLAFGTHQLMTFMDICNHRHCSSTYLNMMVSSVLH